MYYANLRSGTHGYSGEMGSEQLAKNLGEARVIKHALQVNPALTVVCIVVDFSRIVNSSVEYLSSLTDP